MNLVTERIEIVCFACGEVFAHWTRETEAASAELICPRCGHDLSNDPTLLDDAVWESATDEDPTRR